MIINGKLFDAATGMTDSRDTLQRNVGNALWLNEFPRPVRCNGIDKIKLLLLALYHQFICCHISGSFAAYTAGVLTSFKAAVLYIALQEGHELLDIIFQKYPLIENFYLNDFYFQLLDYNPDSDIFVYRVSADDFNISLIIIGVDTVSPCGPRSNVDFVHFIWQNFERFAFKKYSITLVPPSIDDGVNDPTLSFLKYYRAESEGWKDTAQCGVCLLEYKRAIQPCTDCVRTPDCTCNICRRQPPSLFALSARVVFNYVFNIERFELTADTTYDQYVYAVRSNRVHSSKLLPPEYPIIRMFFLFSQHLPQNQHHYHCPGRGTWNGAYLYKFGSPEDAISNLVALKDTLWCNFCEKPLFSTLM
jgi:hypothetical protein